MITILNAQAVNNIQVIRTPKKIKKKHKRWNIHSITKMNQSIKNQKLNLQSLTLLLISHYK